MNRLMFDLVTDTALKHRLDPDLLLAIVMKESEGDPWRPRYEPHYRHLYFVPEWASRLRYTNVETEEVLQKMSWGPMQLMGAVARERGYDDHLHKLAAFPDLALEYSCRHMKWLQQRCHEEADIIACWNGGPGAKNKLPSGMYRNQRYVDDVYQHLIRLRRLA